MTSAATGDLIPIVDISDTTMAASGTTKRVTQSVLLASVQPLDATLTALAAVTTAADKVIYATGVDTFATTDLTSVSRTLLAQTTQALMRTSGLGLGTIATQAASSVAITGGTINGATVGATTPATGAFTSLSATTGANLATISGRVGIGTTSPAVSLDIPAYSTGNSQLQIGSLQCQSYSVCNSFLFDNIYYNGGYKYRYSGFGVGWQSSHTASGDYALLNFASGTAGASATPNARLYIASGGNVGIGTTSPSYLLHVNTDSAGKPGASGLWTVVSDERIKTDIVPADLSRCYDIVKQVGLKHFGYKPGVYSDEQINDKHSLGWIAQDVQKVFGKAVSIKPFTLQTDIPDGTEEYEEQEFTVETVNKVETSIQVINGKPVQASKTTQVEEKTLLFDEVVVVDVAGDIVMVDGAPLTHKVPRMVTKTRPKVRREVIEDCLDLNGGQMNAALYGAVQCLMSKVEAQAVIIASLQASVAEQAHS